MARNRKQEPIAVVGVGALFPGSQDAQGFWRDILAGRDLMRDIPPTHWLLEDYYDANPSAPDKTYARRGAFLDPVPFDPMAFGIPPNIAPSTDSAQLLALVVAQQVLEDAARGQFSGLDRERMSVILGVTSAQGLLAGLTSRLQRPVWKRALLDGGVDPTEVEALCDRISNLYTPWQEASFPGLLGNVVAGRIANRFDLRGTNCVTDAACASSLAALSMGVNELLLGESDLVIAGGADCMNDIFMYVCFSKTPALSPTGDCRPFSDKGDGTMLGEGLGMFALKRLEDAEDAGDHIYAVIRGVGSSSDGRAKSVYAPLPEGQARALRRAYERAGYGCETVELVEAHGTGTKAGDAAEFEGLRSVFGEARAEKGWCALGSVKSQIGHTKAAAGAAGLFKAVMALHHRVLPPTLKVEKPNPLMNVEESPFYLNTKARPWVRDASHPRRASVSSFGFGGSNFHIALEEYVAPQGARSARAQRYAARPTELVLLTGEADAVLRQCRALAEDPRSLLELAHETQRAYDPKAPARLAVVARDKDELRAKLEAAAKQVEAAPKEPFALPDGTSYGVGPATGEVALLFPGQGSQALEMGAELLLHCEEARAVWDRLTASFDGTALHEVVFPPTVFDEGAREAQGKRLTATEWAQPALGVTEMALRAVLERVGVRASLFAGHSFGELSALCAAGAFDEATLVRLARERGERMRDASSTAGAMTALSTDRATAESLLAGIDGVVLANHNHPTQVVLSGTVPGIEAVERAAEKRGLSAKRLSVATAFHSPLVAGAAEAFGAALAGCEVRAPQGTVLADEDAAAYTADVAELKARLARQLARPVRFVDVLEGLYARGARVFVEVGPGGVLSELARRTFGERPHAVVTLDRKGRHGMTSLQEALGRLVAAGVECNPAALLEGERVTPTKTGKPSAMTLWIDGTSYRKPYPTAAQIAQARGEGEGPAQVPVLFRRAQERLALPASSEPQEASYEVTENSVAVSTEPAHEETITYGEFMSNGHSPPPDFSAAWLLAWQEVQRQAADAHTSFQRAMADTHTAYLRTAEQSLVGLAAVLAGQPVPVLAAPVQRVEALPAPARTVVAAPVVYAAPPPVVLSAPAPAPVVVSAPAPAPVAAPPPPPPPPAPAPVAAAPAPAPAPKPAPAPAPVAAPAPTAAAPSAADLTTVMMEVVAEKTGYPVDVLQLPMELEADLGIDSIKRVEILSAMRARVPGLPQVNPQQLGALRTLGQIAEFLEKGAGDALGKAPARGRDGGAPPDLAPVQTLVVELLAKPAPGVATPMLFAGPVVVLGDGSRGALAQRLARAGVDARAAESLPEGASVVLWLAPEVRTAEQGRAAQQQAFSLTRSLAPRLSQGAATLLLVARAEGSFGLGGAGESAWGAGVLGLARTAAHEFPQAVVRALEAPAAWSEAELVERVAREVLEGGAEREVALDADGARRVRVLRERAPSPAKGIALGPADVVVVSGGARGVTARCVLELAKRHRSRVVLLGRTALREEPAGLPPGGDENALRRALLERARAAGGPVQLPKIQAEASKLLASREVRATLASLQEAGSEARYVPADVQDAAALGRALEEVRAAWGPITVLVHGAGVLADKALGEKTDEQWASVFDTKVRGLVALLEATKADPLKALCVFSSVAGQVGNAGQSDYAMANSTLDAVASAEQARRGGSCVVRSLAWGPWDGGMVTPALKAHFTARGVATLGLDAGAKAFAEELTGAAGGADVQRVLVAGGEGGMELAPVPPACGELSLSLESLPVLRDHRVGGAAVVPFAMILSWFAGVAGQGKALTEVRVRRALRVPAEGALRVLLWREGDKLELRDARGGVFDSARVVERNGERPPEKRAASVAAQGEVPAGAYDGTLLFHGPSFQVLRALERVAEPQAEAAVLDAGSMGWAPAHWSCDPAALDGALQLAVRQAHARHGGAWLPMGVERFDLWREGAVQGPLAVRSAELRGDSLEARLEVTLADPAGDAVCTLRGLTLVARPDVDAASLR